MMVSSPLSSCSSTTGEEIIIERDSTDNFIRYEWALKSYFPASFTIEISPEVDKISLMFLEIIFYYVDQIPLPYSSEFETNITMKKCFISEDFDVSIVSVFSGIEDS